MKFHIAVIIALSSLIFVPSCLSKTQAPIEKIPKVGKVNYKIAKVTSTPKVKPDSKQLVTTSTVKTEQKEVILSEFETQVIELVNFERFKQGLSPLTINSKLNLAALNKAKDMVTQKYFAHDSPDKKTLTYFIANTGYLYRLTGENLARGFAAPEEVMNGWMNSPTHQKNILEVRFTDIGVSRYGELTVLFMASHR